LHGVDPIFRVAANVRLFDYPLLEETLYLIIPKVDLLLVPTLNGPVTQFGTGLIFDMQFIRIWFKSLVEVGVLISDRLT
jgi:hypothetical protein